MPESISFDQKSRTVIVRSEGEVTVEDLWASLREVERRCAEHQTERVLVDCRHQLRRPSPSESFEFFAQLPAEIRIAVVIGEGDETFLAEQQFARNVAQNRGRMYECFERESDARAWLEAPH